MFQLFFLLGTTSGEYDPYLAWVLHSKFSGEGTDAEKNQDLSELYVYNLEPHEYQKNLLYALDAFESKGKDPVISKDEMTWMFFKEHKDCSLRFWGWDRWEQHYIAKGDVKLWEKQIQGRKRDKNCHDNWDFFWEGLTDQRDENEQPILPAKHSKLYELIQESFGDYERMRETYMKEAGVKFGHFDRGNFTKEFRNETQTLNPKSSGWLWLLYDQDADKLEIRSHDD